VKTKYFYLFTLLFLIASPSVWLVIHELFGGEAACFEKLGVDSHPLDCSTHLQAIISIVVYFCSRVVTLLLISVSCRRLSAYLIFKLIFSTIAVFSVAYARGLPENFNTTESVKASVELFLPYVTVLLIVFFSKSHWAKIKA
jgi:hypothetical protein